MKTFAAWLFGVMVALRNFLYQVGILPSKRLPGRVISVGNIAVGGTGKSPVVIALGQYFIAKGVHCAVLTRGYKGGLSPSQWLVLINRSRVAGDAPESAHPDEALMQSQVLRDVPIIVGAKRSKAATAWLADAQKLGIPAPAVWILDDGFQHRQIKRDVDLVLLDARKPFGALLPKDLFREPAESLSRAHAILFTRADGRYPRSGDFSYPSVVAPHATIAKVGFDFGTPNRVFAGNVSDKKEWPQLFWLVAGIANPEQLKRAVKEKGMELAGEYLVKDHVAILSDDVKTKMNGSEVPILTTAKDWARSAEALKQVGVDVYVLPMTVDLPQNILNCTVRL